MPLQKNIWEGYALYLFPCRDDRDQAVKDNPTMKRVEPYCRQLFK